MLSSPHWGSWEEKLHAGLKTSLGHIVLIQPELRTKTLAQKEGGGDGKKKKKSGLA